MRVFERELQSQQEASSCFHQDGLALLIANPLSKLLRGVRHRYHLAGEPFYQVRDIKRLAAVCDTFQNAQRRQRRWHGTQLSNERIAYATLAVVTGSGGTIPHEHSQHAGLL